MLNLQILSICIFALELFLCVLVLLKNLSWLRWYVFPLLEAEESKKLKTRRSNFCDESLFFLLVFSTAICVYVFELFYQDIPVKLRLNHSKYSSPFSLFFSFYSKS